LPHGQSNLEAAVLLCHLLGKPQSFLYAWPEKLLSPQQTADYELLVRRRLNGEPIAQILGSREFWTLNLKITPATLIPRAETEQLVERALEHLSGIHSPVVADLGTGSGAIALALAKERPDAEVDATEISTEALDVARHNRDKLNLCNVRFFQGDWYNALPADSRYDLIVSNPPYIPEADRHLEEGDLPFEPRSALASGEDGFHDIGLIVPRAVNHMNPGGWLLVEHGYDQGAGVRDLFQQAKFTAIKTHRDLAGLERITEGKQLIRQ
jgi:release factor glutamine methyltransferase